MTGSGRRRARSRIKSSTDGGDDRSLRIEKPKPHPQYQRDRSRDHSLIRIPSVNLKALLGFGIVLFLLVLFLIHHLINPVERPQTPRVVTPFPAPKIMDLPQVKLLYVCICDYVYNSVVRASLCDLSRESIPPPTSWSPN